jgi:hypothetical protein
MDATDQVMALRDRLNYLTLVTEALWSFIADEGHTEAELQDRIMRIDLSDGRRDKRHLQRASCTKCGAIIVADHCQFCGTRVEDVFAAA